MNRALRRVLVRKKNVPGPTFARLLYILEKTQCLRVSVVSYGSEPSNLAISSPTLATSLPGKPSHRGVFFCSEGGYFGSMKLPPLLQPNKMIVICSPCAAREQIATLTAELALYGPVTVLDGGNRFPAYQIMRMLRRRTPNILPTANRIFLRRAFTCHQMLTLLESTPSMPQPYLILDLLATFQDENVPTSEVSRLLDRCLAQMDRLRMEAPVIVSLAPHADGERLFLHERVCARGDQLLQIEIPYPVVIQPSLF